MPKFTFICEDDPMPFSTGVVTKRTIEFDAVQLNDVVSEFELFLRGAGFNLDGTLDFISDDDYGSGPEWYNEDYETIIEIDHSLDSLNDDWPLHGAGSDVEFGGAGNIHSQYYFDLERNK
jgi:hypothetical protein